METLKNKKALFREVKQTAGKRAAFALIMVVVITGVIFIIIGITTNYFSHHDSMVTFNWIMTIEFCLVPIAYVIGRKIKPIQLAILKEDIDSYNHMIRYWQRRSNEYGATMKEIGGDFAVKITNLLQEDVEGWERLGKERHEFFERKMSEIDEAYKTSDYSDTASDRRDIEMAFAEFESKCDLIILEALQRQSVLDTDKEIRSFTNEIKTSIINYQQKNEEKIDKLALMLNDALTLLKEIEGN